MALQTLSAPFFKAPQQQSTAFFSQPSRQQPLAQSPLINQTQEVQSSDKLSTLHSKLQQEADKIRKWRNLKESEIREKDRKMSEANSTIEVQRKALTHLQLDKEALFAQLREEKSNQREIQHKIEATREICAALRNHAKATESAVLLGEEDRDKLTRLNQSTLTSYQDLLARLQGLEAGQKQWMDKEKQINEQLKSQCLVLEQDLGDKSKQVCLLQGANEEKDEIIQLLTRELEAKSNSLNQIQQERDCLLDELSTRKSELLVLEDELSTVQQLLVNTQDQVKQQELSISELQLASASAQAAHDEEVTALQASLSESSAECQQLNESKSNLENRFSETSRQLSREIESLKSELLNYEAKHKEALGDVADLKSLLSDEGRKVSSLKADNKALQSQLESVNHDLDQQSLHHTTQIEQRDQEMSILKAELERQRSELRAGQDDWTALQTELQTKLLESGNQRTQLEEKASQLEEQLEQSITRANSLQAEYNQSKDKKNDLICKLESEATASCQENLALKLQVKELTVANEELLQDKAIAAHQELKIMDLREDLKSLEQKLKRSEDYKLELETCVEKHRREAKTSHEQFSLVKLGLESQVSVLKEKLADTGEEMKLACKYKAEAEAAREDHEQTRNYFEQQVNDVTELLKKSRAEYQLVMEQRDLEIERLRRLLEQSESTRVAHETELTLYQEKIALLDKELTTSKADLKDLCAAATQLQPDKIQVATTPVSSKPASSLRAAVTSKHAYPDSAKAVLKQRLSSTPVRTPIRSKLHYSLTGNSLKRGRHGDSETVLGKKQRIEARGNEQSVKKNTAKGRGSQKLSSKRQPSKKNESFSWFDSDTVFGFTDADN